MDLGSAAPRASSRAVVLLGVLGLSACAAPVRQVTPTAAPAAAAAPAQAQGIAGEAGSSAPRSAPPGLNVVQDESSLERRIGEYLTTKGVKVEYQARGDDVFVQLDMTADNMPNYRIIIDTTPSGRAKSGSGITERVILLRLFTGLKVSAQRKPQVLAALNLHHSRVWAGTFVVNEEDGELEAQWPLNIAGADATVQPETVFDAWYRLCSSWSDLFPKVAPILFGGAEAPRQGV